MAASGLEARIVALIRDALMVEVAAPDVDMIEGGLLDSLALVALMTEIEREFDFQLPLDDFDVECFRDVRGIAACVAEHRPDLVEAS